MGVLAESIRSKAWILKITLMSIVLGMLLALSLQTQQRVRTESGLTPSATRLPLQQAYIDVKRQNMELRAQIDELEKKITEYDRQISSGATSSSVLNEELQQAKFLAGLMAAEGAGIVVTLRDSKKISGIEGIIHDSDIRNVVNELRAAGAEIVSINSHRLIATSAIRCVGPVTLINGTEVAAPYEIKAIGDPKTLDSGLRMPGGVVESFPDTEMIDIRQEERIVVKPYVVGGKLFTHARPAGK